MEKFDLVTFCDRENPAELFEGDLQLLYDVICDKELCAAKVNEYLADIKDLVAGDLTSEKERKFYKSQYSMKKGVCDSFEKKIKIAKKWAKEIPDKIDIVSRATRAIYEPLFDRLAIPLNDIENQEKLVKKWLDKSGIPKGDKFSLETGLSQLEAIKPSRHSSEAELDKFGKAKSDYIEEWKKALEKELLLEKTEREARERQLKEAERLRLQAEEQRRVAEEQRKAAEALEAEQRRVAEEQRKAAEALEAEKRRVAEEQRKAAEALEAEKRRVAEAAAEIERQKQQAAVNPEAQISNLENSGLGAPPALPSEAKKAMRRAAVDCMAKHIASLGFPDEMAGKIALSLCMAIHARAIDNVRFHYE